MGLWHHFLRLFRPWRRPQDAQSAGRHQGRCHGLTVALEAALLPSMRRRMPGHGRHPVGVPKTLISYSSPQISFFHQKKRASVLSIMDPKDRSAASGHDLTFMGDRGSCGIWHRHHQAPRTTHTTHNVHWSLPAHQKRSSVTMGYG